ncbi:MAG TPA: class I SAM-dependent methyltransferase [Bacteroidia bacterium]|jgi:ubiquinone/menaquinone biosynthesis C-methylase UbiE|nr:class I SAM-dependent methyltransferase [Bacteroidia bacterium]
MKENQLNVVHTYNTVAKAYADKFMDELKHKHLDRILLTAFAAENKHAGKFLDLGCGPGQTTKYLSKCGIRGLTGIDISPEMIETAKQLNPDLHFETGDILKLNYPDKTIGAAIAFYAIVHFTAAELETVFQEIRRCLKEKGEFLFSFHIGKEQVHLDTLLDHQVNIDFYFFETAVVIELLKQTGFEIIDVIERQPYADVEYPSKRAYIWVKRLG